MLIEKRSGRRLMNQINVVPYIDVMLVLLVIFMVTAPMMSPSQIDLPSVSKASTAKLAPLQVIVDAGGQLSFREDGRPERRVGIEELIGLIRKQQAANPEQAVVIAADREVAYKHVVDVMDTLQRNQVQRVGLLVRATQ
ncbi:MAG: protein TolR [Burkholderiales bacterium]|nr:protein TolR [Burkholderiales bacterium]